MPIHELPFVIMRFTDTPEDETIWKHGIRQAIKDALQLGDDEVDRTRIDLSLEQSTPNPEHLPNIKPEILDRIRRSMFVVCDTTGNRPNCYFELGYALAHGKHIFLLHREQQNEEPPHFDLRGVPIRFYRAATDLYTKLTPLIEFHFGHGADRAAREVPGFFDECGLPIVALEGDGLWNYRLTERYERPIMLNRISEQKYSPPNEYKELFNSALASQLQKSSNEGSVVFNGELLRVRDYHPMRDEKERSRMLRLDVEPTDYFTFISTNHGWSHFNETAATALREYENTGTRNLRDSTLANPLTVSLAVIAKHEDQEWVLIQERNTDKTFHCKQQFQCSAAGMVNAHRDLRTTGVDVFAAAVNELREELGVDYREDQVTFLGFIRETKNYEVALVGEVCVEEDPRALWNVGADTFEVLGVHACPLTPEGYVGFVAEHGGLANFVLLGVGCVVYALLKRFSSRNIKEAFKILR